MVLYCSRNCCGFGNYFYFLLRDGAIRLICANQKTTYGRKTTGGRNICIHQLSARYSLYFVRQHCNWDLCKSIKKRKINLIWLLSLSFPGIPVGSQLPALCIEFKRIFFRAWFLLVECSLEARIVQSFLAVHLPGNLLHLASG